MFLIKMNEDLLAVKIRKRMLKDKELFIFDIEGVFIPSIENITSPPPKEALVTLNEIRKMGKKLAFLSNISRIPFRRVADILIELGIAQSRSEVFTAGRVTAEYIDEKKKRARVFVISELGLIVDLEVDRNIKVVFEKPVDFVVVGLKRNITFEEINFALEAVLDGAELISVGHTYYYKGEFLGKKGIFIGDIPICEMLSFASGRSYTRIGKPAPTIFGHVLSEYMVEPGKAVMIGDKLETDIKGANDMGITSVYVESIETQRHFLTPTEKEEIVPSIKLKSLKELLYYI